MTLKWLSGWTHRKRHTIIAGSGVPTSGGYQIPIDVYYGSGTDTGQTMYCSSLCKTDFSDLRFTEPDGQTICDYWLQAKTDSDHAHFIVRVAANLNEDKVICLYYGNSGAVSQSNQAATFFDVITTAPQLAAPCDEAEQEVSPTVLYDDDETVWMVACEGSGSIGLTLSEETTQKQVGTSSLKMVVGSGSYLHAGITQAFAPAKNLSSKTYLGWRWYGANSGNTVMVRLACPGWGDYYYYQFTDNFTGWRQFIVPLVAFLVGNGSPNWNSVGALNFLILNATSGKTTYLDRVIADTRPQALDYSGNARHGTPRTDLEAMTGTTVETWRGGKNGRHYNGEIRGDCIGFGDTWLSASPPTSLTIMARVKLHENKDGGASLIGKNWGDPFLLWFDTADGNKIAFTTFHTDNNQYTVLGNVISLPLNTEANIAVTVTNNGTARFFLNGNQAGSASFPYVMRSNVQTVSSGQYACGYDIPRVHGLLGELFVWSSILTDAQIANLGSASNYPDPTLEAGKVLVRRWATTMQPSHGSWSIQQTFVEEKQGLVVYLPMDETSGTAIADFSGHGNNGTKIGNASWADGKFRGALRFGIGQKINFCAPGGSWADYEELKYKGDDLTIECWFKPDSRDTSGGYLCSKPWSGMGYYNYRVAVLGSAISALVCGDVGHIHSAWSASGVITPDVWNHFALVLKSDRTVNLYVNAVLAISFSHDIAAWVPSAAFYGDANIPLSTALYPYNTEWEDSPDQSLICSLDDYRITLRALSSDEVKVHYVSTVLLDGMPLMLRDGSLSDAIDFVGSNYDSWENGALARKHKSYGSGRVLAFTCIEDAVAVEWEFSAACHLKSHVADGAAVLMVMVAGWKHGLSANQLVYVESVNVSYSENMKVRYFAVRVRCA